MKKGGLVIITQEKAGISDLLCTLKRLLEDKRTRLVVCNNRAKNFVFSYLYGINKSYIKEILSKLEVNDFVEATENTNPNFPKELLYVFTKQVVLVNARGEEDVIQLYIKFSLDDKKKYIITVSFHEAEYGFV